MPEAVGVGIVTVGIASASVMFSPKLRVAFVIDNPVPVTAAVVSVEPSFLI